MTPGRNGQKHKDIPMRVFKDKSDEYLSLVYHIVSLAIPNRKWMFRLLLDNKVIFNLGLIITYKFISRN